MATTDMWNAQYIEAQYKKWKDDPNAVTRDWQFFFKGFEIGGIGPAGDETAGSEDAALQQSRVASLFLPYGPSFAHPWGIRPVAGPAGYFFLYP